MKRFKPNPDDVIIVVMGPTGSGKTNFINALTGNPEKAKASGLASATQTVTPYTMSHQGRRLVLVDTPAFDHTYLSDVEILSLITDWLTTTKYPDGETPRLTGIVYLHRITDNHMSGAAYKSLQMFGRLCGNMALRRVRLVTTKWDLVGSPQSQSETRKKTGNEIRMEIRMELRMEIKMENGKKPRARIKEGAKEDTSMVTKKVNRKESSMVTRKEKESKEQELIKEFWAPLIAAGAIAERFDNTASSALRIVDNLIGLESAKVQLLIQKELVEQQKRLNETEAGKALCSPSQQLLSEQRRTLKELADEARLQNDLSLASELQNECDQINILLEKTLEETKAIKIPLSKRIFLSLFGGKSRGPQAVTLD